MLLEGRGGPTGTAVLYSAVAEGNPFPKGPPKSSVGGAPGWNLPSSARRYGWPPSRSKPQCSP
jgi:hypothetical protein